MWRNTDNTEYDEAAIGYPDTFRNGLYVFGCLAVIAGLAGLVWWLP